MENASKALIMAAGVLIGVLILSLGVYLFINFSSHAKKTYDQIQENQINQFNSSFVALEGKNDITIYDVISIFKRAREYNVTSELDSDDDNFIEVKVTAMNGDSLNTATTKGDKYIEDKFQEWINYDRSQMKNAWIFNSDGEYKGSSTVKLPPYKCENIEYNEFQQVTGVSFEYDQDTWNKWTASPEPTT